MPVILFICTANLFRSPLAAACMKREAEKLADPSTWQIESAGTWTSDGYPAPSITLAQARSLGLAGLEAHRTRQVTDSILVAADLVVVMETGHKEALLSEFPSVRDKLFLLSEIVDGRKYDIPDPAAGVVSPVEVANEIQMLISTGSSKIFTQAEICSRLDPSN